MNYSPSLILTSLMANAALADDVSQDEQMADDPGGLHKALGYEKANMLACSIGERIAQHLVIRHTNLVMKAIFAAPNPGGNEQILAEASIADRLNDPSVPAHAKATLPCLTRQRLRRK